MTAQQALLAEETSLRALLSGVFEAGVREAQNLRLALELTR